MTRSCPTGRRAVADRGVLDHDGQGMPNYGEYYGSEYENRLTIAGHSGTEMGYTVSPPTVHDQSFRRRMFAVVTPDATIVVGVDGDHPGADERTRVLYDRGKSSLRFASRLFDDLSAVLLPSAPTGVLRHVRFPSGPFGLGRVTASHTALKGRRPGSPPSLQTGPGSCPRSPACRADDETLRARPSR